jgi:hypothetical protein
MHPPEEGFSFEPLRAQPDVCLRAPQSSNPYLLVLESPHPPGGVFAFRARYGALARPGKGRPRHPDSQVTPQHWFQADCPSLSGRVHVGG